MVWGSKMNGHANHKSSRREFVQQLVASLGLPAVLPTERAAAATPATSEQSLRTGAGSDVGSLFPFIQAQTLKGEFPLSFLRPQFKKPSAWKRQGRTKLLELLHYSPPSCRPNAEIVERTDCGDYMREKIYFNTTPDIR